MCRHVLGVNVTAILATVVLSTLFAVNLIDLAIVSNDNEILKL
jgi:hypothetical protein